MPDTPYQGGNSRLINEGADSSDGRGVTITSAAANTKPTTFTTLVASAPFECVGIHLYRIGNSLTGAAYWHGLLDIAVGASSSEKIKIADIPYTSTDVIDYPAPHFYFPIAIAAGERISLRFQSSDATETMDFVVILESRGLEPSVGYSLSRTYGAVVADSGGTVCDPGGTANTKGGWTPLVSSTEFAIEKLAVFVLESANNGSSLTKGNFLLDVGLGAATFEKVIIADIPFVTHNSPDQTAPLCLGLFSKFIPKGSRLSINLQSSITNGSDRLIDVVAIAFG